MIQISGVPLQTSSNWPDESTERSILYEMMQSPTDFHFRSMNEVAFETQLRRSIIRSARLMNQSGASFEVFESTRANPMYWYITPLGGIHLRPGVRPSVAIEDIFRNGYLYGYECATAMIIILYHAVLNVIGPALFDQLFQDLYLYSWNFDPDLGLTTTYSSQFIPGDILYFNNPQFNPYTPQWRGESAVLLDDGRYFGHGIGIVTAAEMINILNDLRAPWATQSAYLSNLVTRPSFTYLANISTQRTSRPPKVKFKVIEHNEASIPFDRYVHYLRQAHQS